MLLVFEGALRKWAFPWAQAQIYLVKDVILLGAYLGFLLERRKGRPLAGVGLIKIILVVAFAFGCMEVFNPYSPSVLVGLVGLKTYFLYAPLAFVLPYVFKSREHFLSLIRSYLLITIPVAMLGFVQVAAGPNSFLNTYVSYDDTAAIGVRFGQDNDIVRTSGTFSYISGYSTFLSFIAFLAVGYNIAQGWRIRGNIVPLAALTLAVGAMFTTGSRAPVYTLIAASPVILWLAVRSRVMAIQTAVRLCVLLPVIAVVAVNLSPRAFEGFVDRVSDSQDSASGRLLFGVSEAVGALENVPALGMGIGVTHPSALMLMGSDFPWWLQGVVVEGEMARVAVELGAIGLFLMFGLRILVAVFALRSALSFRDPAFRALGIVLAVYLALGIIGSIILNPTAGLYYWGSLGVVLTMRRLEQTVHANAAAPGLNQIRQRQAADVHARITLRQN
ncbi:MAG TPA: hypothetical protein VHE81_02235 [Lacipirellulaceae bacterium]|nr:hypothetical protein [Lacipirellulaceae bacterium]